MIFGPFKLLYRGIRDLLIVVLLTIAVAGLVGVAVEGHPITLRHAVAAMVTVQIMTVGD